ncbi:MAG: GTPase ObgE [Bacteroidetes bacterium GWF2_43_63]|nr:MAG: GTPase ObgE [Bacteroidetes bacterium GWE2_42_42]OFY54653.1 MAG: GTPase ObgE [Bacteroidetes bacterium GWF2_43_63]HBG71839.1 GTPase ObgE [Bacteroidales bacterium]HCB61422.1 GTPase ObgE [Bacteroidales bacterium]HCY23343.1 GTPase ObgE [Bacteroidales bacterium]
MAESNFIDYVKIYCRSGKGGAGSAHFYRSKVTPLGGPDGGNGGRGGHIIIRGNSQLWTLLHLKYTKHVHSEDGQNGSENRKTGRDGKDVYIDVPLGTVARDSETEEVLFEITKHGEEVILLQGGRGGKGNDFFKTATMQAPRFSQPGEPFLESWTVFELKLLADVGLVGFPNAGKSTLLSVVSAAKPEIADYPFTTLVPNLGVVPYRDDRSFVMADIPGIIEGAHEGRGLGLRFLRHIERNSILLFLIPADSEDALKEYKILLNELKLYNPQLMQKDKIVSVSKCDLIDDAQKKKIATKLKNHHPVFFSSATGIGIPELKDAIWNLMNKSEE